MEMNTIEHIYNALPVANSGAKRNSQQNQYLSFMLSGEIFAIDLICIKEIIEYGHLGEVPQMPQCICGVVNLRDTVVPVIDLGARFCKRMDKVSRGICIIVEIEREGRQHAVGVMVDGVHEVLNIPVSEIEPTLSFGVQESADLISGMAKSDDQFVILLDIDGVLSQEEMSIWADWGAGRPISG